MGGGGGHEGRISRGPLFLPFLQRVLVSSFGMGRDVHFLMLLSIQHFLCRPLRCPPFKVPWGMALERLSWSVTCLNHVSFRLLTIARRGSCESERKFILFHSQPLVVVDRAFTMEKIGLYHIFR